jgi:hypothetical protein
MRLPRIQFSIRRLMVVVTALGLNFGVLPWPASGVMGVVIALSLFVSSGTFLEWVVVYATGGVLAALSMPAVSTNCQRGRIAGPPAPLPAVATPLRAIPLSEAPER